MAFFDIDTKLGTYWVDNFSVDDTRVGIRDVTMVLNRGPDSEFEWSLDQEEALMAAAREAGAQAELLVPGGWRIIPGTALPALKERLKELAASWPVTGRTIRR